MSRVAVAADEKSAIDLDLCNRAMPEVADVLASFKSKFKSSDDFDAEVSSERALLTLFPPVLPVDDSILPASASICWKGKDPTLKVHAESRRQLRAP